MRRRSSSAGSARRSSTIRRRSDNLRFDEFGFAVTKRREQKLHHRSHDYSFPQLSSLRVKELCELLSYWNGSSFICRSQIERFIRMGVPPSLRGRVWRCLLAFDALRETSHFNYEKCLLEVRGPLVDLGVSEYGILSAIATLSETQNDLDLNQTPTCPESRYSVDDITLFRQIALDLQRSFPTHRSLMGDSPEAIEGQAKLFRVLIAFAKYSPQVGYSQGMSYIAAVLLMELGEEDAFWALTALLDKPKYLSEVFDLSLTKVRHQVKVFDQILRHRKPQLSQHLASLGVVSVHFVMPWFLTLFTSLPCWDSVLAVWDLIFLHGLPAVFRTALTIVELLECRLMELKDEASVLPLLLRVPVDTAQYSVLVPALWSTEVQDWELKCMNSLVLEESHERSTEQGEPTTSSPPTAVDGGSDKENVPVEEEQEKEPVPAAKSLLTRVVRLAQRYLLDPMNRQRAEGKGTQNQTKTQTQTKTRQRSPGPGPGRGHRTSASMTQAQIRSRRRSQQRGVVQQRGVAPQGSGGDVTVTDAAGRSDRPDQTFRRAATTPVGKVAGRRSNRGIANPLRVKSLRLLRGAKNPSSSSSSSSSTLTQSIHSAVNTEPQPQGPSLEEKLFSSCDFTAVKTAHVNFKSRQSLAQMGPRAKVSTQFHSSTKSRNWAVAPKDLSSVFVVETQPEGPVSAPTATATAPQNPPAAAAAAAAEPSPQSGSDSGVGVYPQQEHIQPMVPAWIYNDSLVPEMFKKVLEFTMTPAGIDTANLYPILMSSGLPREALGQIWAAANRTTPGMLTKEELYTVLALIGVAQSGLPAMNVEILNQFPSPPVPNLPALAMAMAPVMPQHQQPMMAKPPVSMAMPTPAPAVMAMAPPAAPSQAPSNTNFMASFPPPAPKTDDDDFQDFQEAPKAGAGDQAFDFQGESGGSFTAAIAPQHQTSAAPSMLTPLSGSSSSASASDKYAAFKQLSVDQPAEPTPPPSDFGDKYSVFRQLEQPADKKPVGEGFADFKSVSADDGFTDFKTADSVSPLDPSDQAKIFQPSFPSAFPTSQSLQQLPQQQPPPPLSTAALPQPKNPLNMADLDLFSSMAPSAVDPKPSTFPSVSVPPFGGAKPPGGSDDFGDFALFGSSSEASAPAGGAVAAPQDDFADFMAFGSSGGEPKGESSSVGVQGESLASSSSSSAQQRSDKYDVFKQLSLEGGLAFDDAKESISGVGGGSFSSLRSDADDFADFQSSKFCTALGAAEKTLVDKVAAFKQAKEDSASVKSLDLPSIGGSSAGKDDSEDALSVQLDMKLSDMGGDLKHVMSDSSLDLPGLSAHQPPATEGDDLKFDPFGTSGLSTLTSYDWSDQDCLPEVRKVQAASLPTLTPAPNTDLAFGSTENIPKIPAEDSSSTDDKFEAFADFGAGDQGGGGEDDDDFGDFASTVSEKSDSPAATAEGSEGNQNEASDEFGAFQGDKPKFGKSDFLKASAQTNLKSSEEMIKNELATFDLCVQGSHKRSHSLGDKEIGRSPPSPAPEQPFRDRSSTLSEKPALPVIRDKYKDLTGEVEESERYAYEWQRCLESALEVITKANNILNGISSSSVCTEVIQSAQGMEYLLGVVEVYRVTRRVELGIKATAVCSEKLQQLLKDVSRVWNNLMGFMSLAKLAPDENSLDFSSCILRHGIKNAKELACGVCLLNVEARSKAFNSETDNFKLLYGGHQYHASCANFWINCVEPKPPGLILPDLL